MGVCGVWGTISGAWLRLGRQMLSPPRYEGRERACSSCWKVRGFTGESNQVKLLPPLLLGFRS
jgi:hypothetical protein